MSVEELVKRLRGVDHMSVEDCFLQSPLFGHAADKLEELTAQLLALRKWRQEYVGKLTIVEAALAEKDKEIAALREALEIVIGIGGIAEGNATINYMVNIARRALEAQEKGR